MAKKHNHTPQPPAPAPGAAPAAPPPPEVPPQVPEGQPPVVVQAVDVQAQGFVPPLSPSSEGDPAKLAEARALNVPGTAKKPQTRVYRVNWHLSGFLGKEFHAGDTVRATEVEAAPYLGGVLSLDEDKA